MRMLFIILSVVILTLPKFSFAEEHAVQDQAIQLALAKPEIAVHTVEKEIKEQEKATITLEIPEMAKKDEPEDFKFYVSPNDHVHLKPYSESGSTGVSLQIRW